MAEGASPTTLFLQSIRRDLNCVTDPDRGVRRKALEKLHNRFLQQDDSLPCLHVFQEAWDNVILPIILKAFHDHVEKCRELAISVVHFVVKTIQVEHTITLIIPILIERIGRLPVIEESEEIRLLLIKLVKALVSKCSLEILATNLDCLSQVLSTSLADQFHEIKKEVCDVVALIVSRNESLPPQAVERLVKAVLSNLSHPHSKTLRVLTNIVKAGGSCCNASLSEMLIILIQVQCFGSNAGLEQEVRDLEARIVHAVGFSSTKDLYANQADGLFKLVRPDHESWSIDSYKQALFQKLLLKVGALAGPYIQGLLPVFKTCLLQQDGDPTLRLELLQLLDELFEMPELGLFWSSEAVVVLGQVLVPCGVWRVGKVGAAIRHGAMVAIGTFLRRDLCNQKGLDALLYSDQQMLPIVLSCMEEDYYADVRMVTCHVLENILRISGTSLSEKQREDVRKALENRLDDSNDNVRLRALSAISAFFQSMPTVYSDNSVRSFVNSILLHIDDSNNQIQESVLKTLEVCTSLKPTIVEELVKQNYGHHQMREFCDFLLAKARFVQEKE